jgi:TPR repeat protein
MRKREYVNTGFRNSRRWMTCGLMLSLAWGVAASASGAGIAHSAAETGKAAAYANLPNCPDALYRILPGAFDYCLARKRWVRGWYHESLDMLQRAAAWGSKDAQLALGITYFNGDHVPANRSLGLAWLGLAAERHESRPLQLLTSAYNRATPGERAQAQSLMNDMWPTYADFHAAVLADQQYQRALRKIGEREMYGDGICIKGLTGSPIAGMDAATAHNTVGCPTITSVIRMLDGIYANTMHGWTGTVTVGQPGVVDRQQGNE